MGKTWQEKLAVKTCFPKVLKLEKRFPCYNSARSMRVKIGDPVVLVNASEIIPLMAKIPKGKIITIREICLSIARKHKVKGCCSLVTGVFINIIANVVEEVLAENKKSFLAKIPYWRTLKSEGFLNEKYPDGQEGHKKLLEKEGHKIIARGKKYQVENWQNCLVKI